MKVAYFCRSFYLPSETFIRDLAKYLGQKHDVCVCSMIFRNAVEPSDPYRRIHLRIPPRIRLFRKFRILLGRIGVPASADDYHKYFDRVIHAVAPQIDHYKPDVVYADYGSVGCYLLNYCRDRNIPIVVHFHGVDASATLASAYYKHQVEALLASDAKIIVPSQHMKRLLAIATGCPENISVIPYGVDEQRIAHATNSRKAEVPTIAAVGRMVGKKNPLALIEAFKLVLNKVPHARLEMVGDGPLFQAVADRVSRLGLQENVTLHGLKDHSFALELISRSWIFAQHSVTDLKGDQEGLPVAIIEALMLGVPVVSTIHSGIPEVVQEGKNGRLVREHDFESMATAMVDLLEGGSADSTELPKADLTLERRGRRLEEVLISTQ